MHAQNIDEDEGSEQYLDPLALLDISVWVFIGAMCAYALSLKSCVKPLYNMGLA